ncbi:RNA polymerase sigma factor [Chitinophaga cymbidii]|uniref:DNA-directed RNA polymerase sigma-70 factor n=1 Tax=Chitinophaga cymbidii TaxID=1096750 RepID=A0A512RG82_9BACT|nr:sigma-70 family RNA polymerase sigma factor [Chitinophaga cymbidii]GEP94711.1 DNA-directed RNA polymerase sigma-70 factor [Chitinophaga cymbidii]
MSEALHNENELLQRIAAGDEDAFSRLYKYYQPRLHLFILPLTGFSRQDADEVMQDIFIKVWLRRETLAGIRSAQSYLFTMAKNRLYDMRTQQAQLTKAGHVLQLQQAEGHMEVQEKIQLDEYHEIARLAISRLPQQKRRIFLLRNEQGLSLDEIAAQLNITKFAVKKQLYEAVKSVKDYLKQHAGVDIPIIILIYSCLNRF